MYYIMGEPHGHAKAYFAMKEKIALQTEDKLYVLGDVLGGNSEHPEACLEILEDIMQHDNIQLILGDFEYEYIMATLHIDEDAQEKWRKAVEKHAGGKAFLEYMETMAEGEKKRYINYLTGCDVTEFLEVGGRQFYLVHGAPVACNNDDEVAWQEKALKAVIEPGEDYRKSVLNDPHLKLFKGTNLDNLFVVCGHRVTSDIEYAYSFSFEEFTGNPNKEYCKALVHENVIALHCGCQAQEGDFDLKPTLACMAIGDTKFRIMHLGDLN